MSDVLASTKIYKNYQTVIPKEIRKEFNINDNTVIDWSISDKGEAVINFRQKVTLNDVAGMVKKEDDTVGDWDINRGVYLNE